MPSEPISHAVRRACAEIAGSARWVQVDAEALSEPGGIAGLDPALHFLEGAPEEIARYVLVLDAINFGSGWFASLRLPPGESGTEALSRRLSELARPGRLERHGARDPDEEEPQTGDEHRAAHPVHDAELLR